MKKINLLLTLILPFTLAAQISSFPYTQDFQGTMDPVTDIPTNWSETGLSTDGIWSTDDATNASSGFFTYPANTIFAYSNDDNCNCDKSADRLITPVFDFTGLTSADMTFDYFTGTAGTDFVEVQISTDSGATFTVLDTLTKVATWTGYTLDLDAYTGAGFDKVAIAIFYNDNTSWGYGVGVDNIFVGPPPSCNAPTADSLSGLTTMAANLHWTENGTATNWEVEYGPAGFTAGTGTSVITMSNPLAVTGLTSATAYDWYVRAICGAGDTSVWSNVNSFTTPCPAIATFPYFEGFESGVPPACWSQNVLAGTSTWISNNGNFNGSVTAYAGTANAQFFSPNYNGDAAQLITPSFDLTSLTTPQLEVWHSQVDWGGDQDTLGVYYRTSSSGSWVYLASFNSPITSWSQTLVNLPNPSADYSLMFEAYSGYGYGVTLDNFEIKEAPLCPTPTSPMAMGVLDVTANVSWVENGTATQWQIEYDTAGFSQGTGNLMIANSNPTSLSGLMAETSYDFYVRAICGPADTSMWTNVASFTTRCAAVAAPWTDDVEAHTPTTSLSTSLCWIATANNGTNDWNIDGSGSTPSSGTGPSAANSGTNYFYFEASGGTNGNEAYLETPLVDLTPLTTPRLSFFYHMFGDGRGIMADLYIDVFDGTQFVRVDSIIGEQQTAQAQPFLENTVDLSAFTGAIYIRFTADWNGAQWGDISLDDFTIEETPSCPDPNMLNASSITASSADLAWTENGTATQWQIQYDTAGFTPGTGNLMLTSSNPTTLSGLMSQTSYDWWVRSICGPADTSAWSGPNTFTTACATFVPPFIESFTVNSLPNCWTQGGNTPWEYGPGFNAYGAAGLTDPTAGGGGFFIGMDGSDNSGSDSSWLISPFVDVSSLTTPQLRFLMFSNNIDDAALNRTRVHIWDGSAWIQIDSIQANLGPNWDLRTYDLSTLSITGPTAVRFTITPTTTGGSAFYNDILFDDIEIRETPLCLAPTALAASNVTSSAADLAWTENGTATDWEVEVGPAGFTPGTGAGIATVVSSNPYTVMGLNPATNFDFYVRSICAPGDTSLWSSSSSFITACGPIPAPWFDDVEAHSPTTSLTTSLCWTATANQTTNDWNIDGSGSTPSTGTGPLGANSGSNYFYFEASGGGAGNEAYLLTPEIDLTTLNVPLLKFYYHMFGDGRGVMADLFVDVFDGTNFIAVDSIIGEQQTAQADPFFERLVDISAFTDTIQVRFTAKWNGAQWGDISLDDFSIEEAPTCPRPVSLTNLNVNAMDALVSWDEFGSATQWEVEWDTLGYTLGNASNSAIVNTDTFYLITGLNPETDYEWSVRAICGPADTSTWGSVQGFTTPPTCPMPSALSATPSNTSANLSWTENGSATAWEIEYGAPGFTQGTGTSIIVTTNPYSLTGLTATTSYDWYLRAVCGPADSSTWTTSNTFTTLCNPVAAPFSESFDATTQPACWSQSAVQGGPWTFGGPGFTWNTTQCAGVPTDNTGNNGSFAALDFSVPDAGVVLELPIIDVNTLTTPFLSFFYRQCDNFSPNNVLYIEGYDGTTWNMVDSITRGTNGWEEFGFVLSSAVYNTNFVRIRFRAEDGGGVQFYGDMGIDDVSVDEAPSCLDPTNPASSAIGTTTATLAWVENGTATTWEVEIGAPGFTPGTGAGAISIVTTNPYNAAGLSIATAYDFYVRSICGAADTSGYTTVSSFTTQCLAFSAPYSENFDGATTPGLPSCWSAINALGVNLQTVTSTDHGVTIPSSPNCIEYDVATGTGAYLITPAFSDLSSGMNQVRVQLAFEGGASTFPGQIIVGTLADASDTTTFTPYDTIDGLTEIGLGFTEITIRFDRTSVIGTDSIIAFKNINGGGGFEFFLDDFVYEEIPAPYYPIGIINTVDANGVADSLGVEVRTSGTVVGVDLDGNNGLSFYIIDMSTSTQEGINIFNFNDVSNYVVNEGDSIMVWGDVDQFNGLQEVIPDSIMIIKTNALVPAPRKVTMLDESTEANHIQMDSLVVVTGSGTGSFNMTLSDGTNNFTMRVDADTDVSDSLAIAPLIPGDTICSVIGVGGQFDNSSPYTDGYQIFPMRFSDLDTTSCQVTGIFSRKANESRLNIFPNPTSGEVTIQANNIKSNDARIMVRDISGKIMFEDRINKSEFSTTIDFSRNAKGIYFISIIDGDETYNEKLIKN